MLQTIRKMGKQGMLKVRQELYLKHQIRKPRQDVEVFLLLAIEPFIQEPKNITI